MSMRKAERIIRDKNKRLPEQYKKVDTSINGDAEHLAEKHKDVEKKLYPLRIDSRTIIYVTKDKLTPEYAEKKRKSMNLERKVEKKGGTTQVEIDVEKLREMVHAGMSPNDIAKELGVSRTTMYSYIKKYDLRNGNRQRTLD